LSTLSWWGALPNLTRPSRLPCHSVSFPLRSRLLPRFVTASPPLVVPPPFIHSRTPPPLSRTARVHLKVTTARVAPAGSAIDPRNPRGFVIQITFPKTQSGPQCGRFCDSLNNSLVLKNPLPYLLGSFFFLPSLKQPPGR